MSTQTLDAAMLIFRALVELSRARIVAALIERKGAATVGDLQETVEMPQSTVSRHLRVLLDAGIVSVTRNGEQRVYQLDVHREALAAVETLVLAVRSCQRPDEQ